VATGPPGPVRRARRGLARTPVGDLDAEHLVLAGDQQLVRALGVQTGVRDQLGDDQQDILGRGPLVGGGAGSQPHSYNA
jgi:hypothetical protein